MGRLQTANPPVLLAVVLMVVGGAREAEAQARRQLTPYNCFFNQCPASKADPDIMKALGECLKAAVAGGDRGNAVVLPGSPEFAEAKSMVGTRFQRTPAAVVYAHSTPDVQAAVKCAYNNGVRVSVAGGRHSYEGWSVVDNYLVVDMSNMTEVRVTGRQGSVLTVDVGPGNTNALLISQLHKAGYSTGGTIIGQCPSVGVSGFILGGGQGDLSRMFGLACDQLVGLEMVDYKGDVVTASAQLNSDLLWASCGGGGGLGVVTRWTVKAHDLGKEPFSRIKLRYSTTIGKAVFASMLKLQEFIMSDKTDLRFSGGGAGLSEFNLYFAGPLSTSMRLLKEAGLLNPDWLDKGMPSRAIQDQGHLAQAPVPIAASALPDLPAYGVPLAVEYRNYYETIMAAECAWVAGPPERDVNPAVGYGSAAAKVGFGPSKSCNDPAIMARYKAMAAQPGSPINSGIGDIWKQYTLSSACRLVPPLNATAWEALAAVYLDPRCAATSFPTPSATAYYYCLALKTLVSPPIWNHLLGGAVAKIAPTATAYPWRKAISPLCVDSGMPPDALEADGHTFKSTFTMDVGSQKGVPVSPAALAKGIQDVQGAYLKVLYQVLGEDTARDAYLNYQTGQVEDYAEAYWGPNYKRLQQIKAKWDPRGLFSKPFTVQPATA